MAPLQQILSFQNSREMIAVRSAPSTSVTAPPSKKVSFYQTVAVRTMLSLEDLTADEMAATWYSQSELRGIRTRIRNDIKSFSAGRLTNDASTFELRGIESFLPEGLEIKQLRRTIARNALLEEQEHQWNHNKDDPERLADVYFDRTRESTATAHVQGLADHEVVHQDSDGPSNPPSTEIHNAKGLFKSGSIGSSLHRRQPLEYACRAA